MRSLFVAIAITVCSSDLGLGNPPAPVVELRIDSVDVSWMSFDETGTALSLRYVVADHHSKIRVWDVKTWKYSELDVVDANIDAGYPYTRRFAFTKDGVFLGIGHKVFVAAKGEKPKLSKALDLKPFEARHVHNSIDPSPDGKRLFMQTIIDDKRLVISEIGREKGSASIQLRNTWEINTNRISAVQISPDGSRVAIGTVIDQKEQDRYELELWDRETKKKAYARESHELWIRSIAISRDGKYVVSGGFDGRLICWDLATGEVNLSLVQKRAISSIVTDSERGLLFFTTFDRDGSDNFKIVDLKRKEIVFSASVDKTAAHLVTLAPDGKLVATIGSEGVLLVWDVQKLLAGRTVDKSK